MHASQEDSLKCSENYNDQFTALASQANQVSMEIDQNHHSAETT